MKDLKSWVDQQSEQGISAMAIRTGAFVYGLTTDIDSVFFLITKIDTDTNTPVEGPLRGDKWSLSCALNGVFLRLFLREKEILMTNPITEIFGLEEMIRIRDSKSA